MKIGSSGRGSVARISCSVGVCTQERAASWGWPPPTPGTLQVTPRTLALTAAAGKAVSGTLIVTAVGGPVNFTISSGSAKVVVSPSSGSLGAAGTWQTITVTARSLIAVSTHLVVKPGNIAVTVVLTIKV